MLAPERMPMAEGKKMANIWKKLPSGPLQFGFRLSKKISPVENVRFQRRCIKETDLLKMYCMIFETDANKYIVM